MEHDARQVVLDLMRDAARLEPGSQWLCEVPGAFAMVTGVPFPTLNGILWHGDADTSKVAELIKEVAQAEVPRGLQAVPECLAVAEALAGEMGMVRGPDIPLMTLTEIPAAIPIDGLSIRELPSDRFDLRTQVAAAGFDVDAAAIQAATALFGRTPGYRMYLGEVAGTAVTTAVSVTGTDSVGVFDVATPPEHRGHGYGAAITAHATREGFNHGATWAWLQSSPEGFRVYRRLGFRTQEQWALWVAA